MHVQLYASPPLSPLSFVVFDNRPVGPILDQLLKEEVVEEGDGLSLGLSPSMMKFFSLQGPFIGVYSV